MPVARPLRIVLVGVIILLAGPVARGHDGPIAACETLVMNYAYHRDRADAEAVGALFTKDATLTIGADSWKGRDRIIERVRQGIGGPVFRHLMSTIHIELVDARHARGVSYATVYSAPPGNLPRTQEKFLAIGEYHDNFVLTDAGWRIAQREFKIVMVPDTGS